MIDLRANEERLVAFVGAGASAIPPSNLPSWTGFNDLLLECLCERLAEYSQNRQPTDQMLKAFRERRDLTQFLAPDFQAQLMEEEVGEAYFRVWRSIETTNCSPVHEDLAELATQGRLAAIITTNFDRLCEIALEARDVEAVVYYDRETFEKLASGDVGHDDGAMPVIKIHGTIEHEASVVDTLRQRLVGRPAPLMMAIQVLLRRYPWLFLGFSGADFSYDRNYLGILDAADESRGFVFLARPGARVEKGVQELANAFGEEKAAIVEGDLTTWLSKTFELPERASDGDIGKGQAPPVKERILEWTQELGQMSVVNILCAMLKTVGMEHDALWLLRRTWKSYRVPEETKGPCYARYNYNYGLSLLERGFISNPVALADDMSNLMEWKEHADQNAYEYLARSYEENRFGPAAAALACVLAYRGECGKAIGLIAKITDEVLDRDARLEFCDVAIASSVLYDMVFTFGPAIGQFERCLEISTELGDEPRRAMLCALLGRFHTYRSEFDKADGYLAEAERVAERLDLRSVRMAAQAARGVWLADSHESVTDGVGLLTQVLETLHAIDDVPLFVKVDLMDDQPSPNVVKGKHPMLCRVLLDLNRAAMFAGDGETLNAALDELDEIATEPFVGYAPLYYLNYAQCLLVSGGDQKDQAAELISRAKRVGDEFGNPGVVEVAKHLEQQI